MQHWSCKNISRLQLPQDQPLICITWIHCTQISQIPCHVLTVFSWPVRAHDKDPRLPALAFKVLTPEVPKPNVLQYSANNCFKAPGTTDTMTTRDYNICLLYSEDSHLSTGGGSHIWPLKAPNPEVFWTVSKTNTFSSTFKHWLLILCLTLCLAPSPTSILSL